MVDLKIRDTCHELMDDPAGDKGLLFATLRQFKLINRLFTRSRFLAKSFVHDYVRGSRLSPLTLFDLGSGGCDFALWFSRYLSSRNIKGKILCIDNDPRVVEFAHKACSGNNAVAIIGASALCIDKIDNNPDYIFSCHLLHHLSDEDVVTMLRKISAKARRGYILNDLERSGGWHFLFGLFSLLFFRNSFARADGLLSIRKSFTKKELESIIDRSGVTPRPQVRQLFPGRLVVEHFIDQP